MPRQRSVERSRGGATVIAIALTILVALVVGLSIAALRQGRSPGEAGATAGPAPTFTYADRTPSARPPASSTRAHTPTPTPTPTTASAPGPDERFLSVGADAMWRATAGACGALAPVIERSSDGGATWQTVTPTAKGISQVLSLTSFGGRNATAAAEIGSGCTKNTLRTYTDGQFWEPYPDIFATDTYALAGARAVVIDGTRTEAPCATPWGLRSAGGVTALICDGTAYRLDGRTWTALSPGARALAVIDSSVYVAHTDAACPGIRITAHPAEGAATDLGCTDLGGSDSALALDASSGASGTSLTLWAGSRLIEIAG